MARVDFIDISLEFLKADRIAFKHFPVIIKFFLQHLIR